MITKKQIAALKYLIYESKDGNDLAKRIASFLVDKSRRMKREVCVTFVADREGFSAKEIHEVARAFGSFSSCNRSTHLGALCHLMGSELLFSVHYGDYCKSRNEPLDNKGQFAGWSKEQVTDPKLTIKEQPMRYTFWLAKKYYSRTAHLVTGSKEEISRINLKKPGLYPRQEPAD